MPSLFPYLRHLWVLAFVAFATVRVFAADPLPSECITKSEVAKLTGLTLPDPITTPPDTDDDFGAKLVVDMYRLEKGGAMVAVYTFPSASAAKERVVKAKISFLLGEEDPASVTVKEEAGVGDAAYWATHVRGFAFVAVKGKHALVLSGIDKLPKPAASYHDAARELAIKGLTKL